MSGCDKGFIQYVELLRDHGTVADLENCFHNARETYMQYMKAKEISNLSNSHLEWLNDLIIQQMTRIYFIESVLISRINSRK